MAQDSLFIYKNDGSITPFVIAKVDSISLTTPVVKDFSLDTISLKLTINEQYTFAAKVIPLTVTYIISWTSSNPAVASVIDGKLTALAPGNTTVTASVGNKTVICAVRVVDGIKMNGVIWAQTNVAAPGTFATNPEDAGLFYQWNSKLGWPVTGAVDSIVTTDGTTTWNSSWNGGFTIPSVNDTWADSNSPCPPGYRTPTAAEIRTLANAAKVTLTRTTLNGISGGRFTDKTTGNSIFLPGSGFRNDIDFMLYMPGMVGLYWGSAAGNDRTASDLAFSVYGCAQGTGYRPAGFLVRPVAE